MDQLLADVDGDADVLYLSRGAPRPDYVDREVGGVLYRIAYADEAPCGVTVLGFVVNGTYHDPRFYASAAEFLGVSYRVVEDVVRNALVAELRRALRSGKGL